ncbi:hypothetical protein ALQ07_101875 [Pseudomonas syringae pv. actinidiae]|uniref:Uncharacterized protein n=2 Tax=Pseudomonas syringae group TaxID=136849 RepID=A0A2V0Q542_PSESF|nr:hypothetical protein ALQ94_101421 [Pseudomonas amygdali pv. morsprunorum]RMQ30214.1 hypothetical protein ALQ07_101875 [Pseudomonas syringae pv. actinidiae]GBH07531.1 hypothetical protein KPSA1_00890 [Pseudomonas syringae pv. actinidiae]GBH20878.1 hypothetical protein KPSA3_06916 [Pseudomonas syringae pv. actinidiae]
MQAYGPHSATAPSRCLTSLPPCASAHLNIANAVPTEHSAGKTINA